MSPSPRAADPEPFGEPVVSPYLPTLGCLGSSHRYAAVLSSHSCRDPAWVREKSAAVRLA
ncbi:hypothetical protein ACFVRB_31375 [Streptomyces nojiriensis]|uniref:hypothetical protein n=1 Tax=Streptomyces nojiriensis TaxID=66374 RepID=UPI0036DC4B50